jgi:Lipid A 3-O-deacylase (PagL)
MCISATVVSMRKEMCTESLRLQAKFKLPQTALDPSMNARSPMTPGRNKIAVDIFAFEDFGLPVFDASYSIKGQGPAYPGIFHPISANKGAESACLSGGLPLSPQLNKSKHKPVPLPADRNIRRLLTGIGFGLFSFFVLAQACRGEAQDYLVGVRGGATFEGDAGDFQQVDVYAGRYLPWLWGFQNGLNFKPRVEASAGWLHSEGDSGFVGTLGPVIELRIRKFPVTLEGGVSLTALSRSDFPQRNLGGWFEFTDHVGINWHITKQLTIGWRYQHMSNAGIYQRNPGLNQQMLSASYSF